MRRKRRKPSFTTNPRLKLHPNENVTISGVSWSDARSILTVAWLYCNEQIKKDGAGCDCSRCQQYYPRLKKVIQSLQKQAEAAVTPPKPARYLKETLRERKEERDLINSILDEAIANALAEGERLERELASIAQPRRR